MEKEKNKLNHFDKPNTIDTSYRLNEKKTTDINILLNRVIRNRKIEFKKKIIFSLVVFLFVSFVSFCLFIY